MGEKLLQLDSFAYLHAQLSFSLILRLPITGKSINADLSHFIGSFSNKKKAIKKMADLGKKIANRLIEKRIKKSLLERSGQIVFISDQPMKWLRLEKYPLALTYDVCRIPEFNSRVNNFINNQRTNFTIKKDIIEKTLVIHCTGCDDKYSHSYFKVIDSYKNEIGFKGETCETIEQIKRTIDEHQRKILKLRNTNNDK